MSTPAPHLPVLLDECLRAFEGVELKRFVDGTLGAAGHASALLAAHQEMELLIGIDQDRGALKEAEERLKLFPKDRYRLFLGNFDSIDKHLEGIEVDGILVDLGVSSMQLDQPERGFSFMREGPLDMRMNQEGDVTAAEIVNTWGERELRELFFRYGEEKEARKIARAICEDRQKTPFKTTRELASLMERIVRSPRHIHPATRVFQALRIEVNRELERLEHFIPKALKVLRKGGRLAIITFHSLEDRIVKQAFAGAASDKVSTSGIGGIFLPKEPQVRILTRKPIEPTEQETQNNPRSRSAKMRVAEKIL